MLDVRRHGVTTLLRDARFGTRLLLRNPGFTAVAVITLALGISATTAIFSVIYGTFLAPLPYRDADGLVMLWSKFQGDRIPVTTRDFVEWKRQASSFSDLNAWGLGSIVVATDGGPESLQSGNATPGFLAMLGYGRPLALGRTFREDEGSPGRDRVAVLTYRLWRDGFAGDPAIIGRAIRLHGSLLYTVVGVLGEGPADRQQVKLWLPLAIVPGEPGDDTPWLNVMGRLKPGVTVAQANANLDAVARAIERARGQDRVDWSASVEPFRNNFMRNSTKQGLWLLLGAVAFLLLIACANVANLLLGRGAARQRELAVRTSVGATPGALVRQLLVESMVLATAGGVVGVALAIALVKVIVTLIPPYTLPSEAEIGLSLPVLLFALAACTVAGLVAACAPAWQASRATLVESLNKGSGAIFGRRHGLGRVLVVVEFALALTLLAGGGVAIHALIRMLNADTGFRTDRVLTFTLGVPDGRITTPQQAERFHRELLTRIGTLPGVASSAVSIDLPQMRHFYTQPFEIVGRPIGDPANRPETYVNMVSPAYFDTYGISIRRGRAFTNRDTASGLPVAIVNETFVKRYLADVDPLTARVLMSPSPRGDGRMPPPRMAHHRRLRSDPKCRSGPRRGSRAGRAVLAGPVGDGDGGSARHRPRAGRRARSGPNHSCVGPGPAAG
jgi:putative ABC transport system permease protein